MSEAPQAPQRIYSLRLLALSHVADPDKTMRLALKILLRRCGLKCLSVVTETPRKEESKGAPVH
jgi:hypothetical protein